MKKYFYKILSILITVLLTACTTYSETKYYSETNSYTDTNLKKLNADGTDKSIVFFTGYFDNEIVEMKIGNEIIYRKNVKTIEQLGIADLEVISNLKNIKVVVYSPSEKTIVLKSKDLKKYKYIYISKDNYKSKNEYLVEFTNKARAFL